MEKVGLGPLSGCPRSVPPTNISDWRCDHVVTPRANDPGFDQITYRVLFRITVGEDHERIDFRRLPAKATLKHQLMFRGGPVDQHLDHIANFLLLRPRDDLL